MRIASNTQTRRFPAMENLINSLSGDELIVLSGFLTACLGTSASSIATAVDALIAYDNKPSDEKDTPIDVIGRAANLILQGMSSISEVIKGRLQELNRSDPLLCGIAAHEQLQSKERLRRAFPGIEME